MNDVERSDECAAVAAAMAIGIDLPHACVAGVAANLALLASHAAILDRFLDQQPDA